MAYTKGWKFEITGFGVAIQIWPIFFFVLIFEGDTARVFNGNKKTFSKVTNFLSMYSNIRFSLYIPFERRWKLCYPHTPTIYKFI